MGVIFYQEYIQVCICFFRKKDKGWSLNTKILMSYLIHMISILRNYSTPKKPNLNLRSSEYYRFFFK